MPPPFDIVWFCSGLHSFEDLFCFFDFLFFFQMNFFGMIEQRHALISSDHLQNELISAEET